MIELCSKRRMLIAIVLLVCLSVIIVILENILTPDSSHGRYLPVVSETSPIARNHSTPASPALPCWQTQVFTVVEACRPCTEFERASQHRPECAKSSFIEVIKCEEGTKVIRGCDQLAQRGPRRFWQFEAVALLVWLVSGSAVLVRQRQLERGALSKIRRQLAAEV